MEEVSSQLAASEGRCEKLEEELQETSTTSETVTTKVDHLTTENLRLIKTIEDWEKEKEDTVKRIAVLEFNNEHNINKVCNA